MRSSLGWPITLGVVMLVLVVLLLIGWIIFTFGYWSVLVTGTIFFVLVGVGIVLYLSLSIKEINLTRRQSNFIDSVTHELKSPIASLKLYLQTLTRRNVSEEEREAFHKFMMEDVERLDTLISNLLDVARFDRRASDPTEDIPLAEVLQSCAKAACLRHNVDLST